MLRKKAVLGLVLWSVACVLGVGLGVYHLIISIRNAKNPCTMTYMYPHYRNIPMVNRSRLGFKYRLFRFSNGLSFEELPPSLTSKIVVFIPGSTGSFGQVRSIGSETLNRVVSKSDIAFYTLDFNEEPSGFSGFFLEQQVEFLNDSIKRIVELHQNATGDLRIVLYGHSMGGVVARAMVDHLDSSEEEFRKAIIGILTLSTPHIAPVVGSDIVMFRMYRSLALHQDSTRIYISLAGGYRDILVRSELAQLHKTQYKRSVSALTSSVKNIDLSIDHLAILWCKELVLALAAEIVDIFDGKGDNPKLFDSLKKKVIPKQGYVRKSIEKLGLGTAYGLASDSISYFADTVARKFLPGIFQYVFALGLVLTAFISSGSLWELSLWTVLWYLAFILDMHLFSFWAVPFILVGLCTCISVAELFVARFMFPVLQKMLPNFHLLSAISAFGFVQYRLGFVVSWSHYLAGLFVWEAINALYLVLGNLAASSRTSEIWDGHHVQMLFGLAYSGSLAAWVSPFVQSLSLFSSPLAFADIFPVDLDSTSRSFIHGLPLGEIPDVFKDEDGNVVQNSTLYVTSNIGFTIWESTFLVLSIVTLAPVLFHLSLLYYFPVFASEEKILDSQYQKMVRPRVSEDQVFEFDSEDSPIMDSSGSACKTWNTDEDEATLFAEEDESGTLYFSDVELLDGPDRVQFANGEVVQIETLKRHSAEKVYDSNAVNLIEEDRSGSNSKHQLVLVQRIRSASQPFPQSRFLRQVLLICAFVGSILGAHYLFLLQFLAPTVALFCVLIGRDSVPMERVIHQPLN